MIFIHIVYHSNSRGYTEGGGNGREDGDGDVMILGIRNKLRFLP